MLPVLGQVADVVSKWMRIERQEKATVESVSMDRHAANAFQSYLQSALAFSIKRGGILYGSGGCVTAHEKIHQYAVYQGFVCV